MRLNPPIKDKTPKGFWNKAYYVLNHLNYKVSKKWLDLWSKDIEPKERPSWDQYFMMMAILAATRSPDAQWQAGAVIVNKDKHIIGTGYNGFPPGLPDEYMPNLRPSKYKWVLHAEENALFNCTENPAGGTMYTNGEPCHECLKRCVANGVTDFVVTKGKSNMCKDVESEGSAISQTIKLLNDVSIREISIDNKWLDLFSEIVLKSG